MAAKRKTKNIYFTPEPNWPQLKLAKTNEEKIESFRLAEFFVHYEIDNKTKVKATKEFLKSYKLTKEQRKQINLLPDYSFVHMGKYLWIATKLGFTFKDLEKRVEETVINWIEASKDLIEEKKEEEASTPDKKVISIQQRMREQVEDLCGEWEGYLDEIILGTFDLKKFEPYNQMRGFGGGLIKANHAKIIKDQFNSQYEEAKLVAEFKDEEIKEAYEHLTPKQRKDMLSFFEKINNACETYIKTGKAQRKTRKPKQVSKEKIIAKLNFQVNDSKLGIASINPVDILGAREVWVYNTKYRKIGVYKAEDKGPSLSVKGASIINFDEAHSYQKTLRKPEEQLKQFKGNARTKYAKAFNEINAVETKLNGRLNANAVILKAFN